MIHLSAEDIIIGHDYAIERYGGMPGLTDPQKVEVLIERVRNFERYEGNTNVFALAAMYCVAIARGHVFVDGNKRTAMNACYLFLKRNGVHTRALPDLEEVIIEVATGKMKVEALSSYLNRAFGE